jgi:heme exporter protein D
MQWESWNAFWHMGGAAPFVWGSYGLTAVLVTGELIAVARRRKTTVRRLLRLRRVGANGGGRGRAFEEVVE